MGYLVSRGKNGIISYSGTEYANPVHGTRRLCIRTGSGENGVVKYGLTSDSSAVSYCGLRVHVDGVAAYIGRSIKPMQSSSFSSSATSTSQSYSYNSYSYAGSAATKSTTNSYSQPYFYNAGSGSTSYMSTTDMGAGAAECSVSLTTSKQTKLNSYGTSRTANGGSRRTFYYTTRSVTVANCYSTCSVSCGGTGVEHNFNM